MKAVSNMIATLVLIGIAVVAGVVVYSVFTNVAGVTSTNANVYVVNLQALYVDSSGSTIYTVTLKNAGNVAIQGIVVSVDGRPLGVQPSWTPKFSSSSPLQGGSSATTNWSGTAPLGSTHLVTFIVTALNGGSVTVTESVTVQ